MKIKTGLKVIILFVLIAVPTALLAVDDTPPSTPVIPPDEATSSNTSNNTTQSELQNKVENATQVKGRVTEYCNYLPGRLKAVTEAKKITGDSLSKINSEISNIENICKNLESYSPESAKNTSEYERKTSEFKVNFGKFIQATDRVSVQLQES